MPAVSINLSDESYEIMNDVMKEKGWNRSKTVSYLIRMGWIYRYRVLLGEGISKEKEKNG